MTRIECNNTNISSLTGIEYFTNLEMLSCGYNQLTSLDISKNTKLNPDFFEVYDNCYAITAVNNMFDLSTLPGSFNVSKASDWNGATVTDGKLTIPDGVSKVTYKYDIGQNQSETFTLNVTHEHNHSWSVDWSSDKAAHWHEYTVTGCPTADNSEKDGYALHTDKNTDHICDICGKTLSEHTGGKATCTEKAVCDYCGKEYDETDPSNHANLKHIEAKGATSSSEGNTEYWYCDGCDKYYSDEKATTEIKKESTVIAKLVPVNVRTAPIITSGNGATVTQGEKKELAFTSNAESYDFIRAEVDGVTLDEANYTKSGSTTVTLKADYVASLPVGEHTLNIVSVGGTATAKFTVNKKAEVTTDATDETTTESDKKSKVDRKTKTTEKSQKSQSTGTKSPLTGNNEYIVWFGLLLAGSSVFIGTVVIVKRKKKAQ